MTNEKPNHSRQTKSSKVGLEDEKQGSLDSSKMQENKTADKPLSEKKFEMCLKDMKRIDATHIEGYWESDLKQALAQLQEYIFQRSGNTPIAKNIIEKLKQIFGEELVK